MNVSVVPLPSASYFASVKVGTLNIFVYKLRSSAVSKVFAAVVTIKSSFSASGGMSEHGICHTLGKFVTFYFNIIDTKDILSKQLLNRVIKHTETSSKSWQY